MGLLKKAVKGIGKVGRKALGAVGDVAKVALPAAAFIPGVNVGVGALAGLGALAGAAGSLNDKNPDGSYRGVTLGRLGGSALKSAATTKIAGAAAGGLRSAGGVGGMIGKAGSVLPGGGAGGAAVAGGTGAGGLGGVLKGAGNYLLKNPDLALAGMSIYGNAKAQGNANKLSNEALAIARQKHASMEPIRAQMLQRLKVMGEAAPVGVSLADPHNPYG